MAEGEPVYRQISIVPPRSIADGAFRLRDLIPSAQRTVDMVGDSPLIVLYQCAIPAEKDEELQKRFQGFVGGWHDYFDITLSRYSVFERQILWLVEPGDELLTLHRHIVEAVQPLLSTYLIPTYHQHLMAGGYDIGADMRMNIRSHGIPFAGDYFRAYLPLIGDGLDLSQILHGLPADLSCTGTWSEMALHAIDGDCRNPRLLTSVRIDPRR